MDVAALGGRGDHGLPGGQAGGYVAQPGQLLRGLGVGGLGHIALQCLHQLCGTRTVAIDEKEEARKLAQELGAAFVLDGGPMW